MILMPRMEKEERCISISDWPLEDTMIEVRIQSNKSRIMVFVACFKKMEQNKPRNNDRDLREFDDNTTILFSKVRIAVDAFHQWLVSMR